MPMTRLCAVSCVIGLVLLSAGCKKKSSTTSTTTPIKAFLYVPSVDDGSIAVYSLSSSTGAMTEVAGSPFAGNTTTPSVCANADGTFLYGINYNTISVYSINTDDGVLTQIGSPVATGLAGGAQCAVTQNGKFLILTHYSTVTPRVSSWSINQTTGVPSQVSGSPYVTSNEAYGLAITADSAFIYATHLSNAIRGWSIDSTTGALTPVAGSPYALTSYAEGIKINPAGDKLYAMQAAGGRVTYQTINPSTGELGAETGTNSTTEDFSSGCFAPEGDFLYVLDYDQYIARFAVAADGSVAKQANVTLPALSTPTNCSISSNGKFLYGNGQNTDKVLAYSIEDTTGALTALDSSPMATSNHPGFMTIVSY